MILQKTVKIALIAMAILLLFATTTSAADVSYSYELNTTGGTLKADDEHVSLAGSSENQYSLHINAVNADNASCNHSFTEGSSEITSQTNATYTRAAIGPDGFISRLIGGADLTENIGGAAVAGVGTSPATCYQGAIGFTSEGDVIRIFSSDGRSIGGADTYYNISAARGVGSFTAGLDSTDVGKTGSSGDWTLDTKKRTSSRVGIRRGDYNFRANYHVSRS